MSSIELTPIGAVLNDSEASGGFNFFLQFVPDIHGRGRAKASPSRRFSFQRWANVLGVWVAGGIVAKAKKISRLSEQ